MCCIDILLFFCLFTGAPVATIAPLLPGQPTNLMVTNTVAPTPTITTQCFPKGNPLPPINPLAICVSSTPPVALSTPPVCAQATAPPPPLPQPSTDILAKAAEAKAAADKAVSLQVRESLFLRVIQICRNKGNTRNAIDNDFLGAIEVIWPFDPTRLIEEHRFMFETLEPGRYYR